MDMTQDSEQVQQTQGEQETQQEQQSDDVKQQEQTQKEEIQKQEEFLKDPEKCMELKNKANQIFQQNDFDQAIDVYKQALDYCPEDDAKMMAILFSNISICHIKMHEYEDTIEYTTNALKYNPEFVKAYLNRAEAYENTEKLEEALEGMNRDYLDYKKLVELQPNDYKIIQKKAQLEIDVQKLQEKRKDEVLKGLKDLGNTILGKFGLSLNNFNLQQNENGSYNVQFKQ